MAKKTVIDFIEDATKNIVDDRAATKSLLMNLLKYMQISDDRHKEVGLIAAKYLETLQRSNEQLVKLAGLMQKKENNKEGISEEDKQELFDLINQDQEEE
jgi:hypothetical protein